MELAKEKPPAKREAFSWYDVAEILRAEPGEWFRIPDGHPGAVATCIVRGMPQAFLPAGSFEACTRKGVLYIRFAGEPVEPIAEPWLLGVHSKVKRQPIDQTRREQ